MFHPEHCPIHPVMPSSPVEEQLERLRQELERLKTQVDALCKKREAGLK